GLYTPGNVTSLEVRVRDLGGDPYWVINALDVRPVELISPLNLVRVDGKPAGAGSVVDADGFTVDYYTGSKAIPGSLGTISLTSATGAVVDADGVSGDGLQPDARANLTGFQVVADANGDFGFGVRRPTGSGPSTVLAEDFTGFRASTFDQQYQLPTVRRVDFGTPTSPAAAGYGGWSDQP